MNQSSAEWSWIDLSVRHCMNSGQTGRLTIGRHVLSGTHYVQLFMTAMHSSCYEAWLGCGGTAALQHEDAAYKSFLTAWCYHVHREQNLRRVYSTLLNQKKKKLGSSEEKRGLKLKLRSDIWWVNRDCTCYEYTCYMWKENKNLFLSSSEISHLFKTKVGAIQRFTLYSRNCMSMFSFYRVSFLINCFQSFAWFPVRKKKESFQSVLLWDPLFKAVFIRAWCHFDVDLL